MSALREIATVKQKPAEARAVVRIGTVRTPGASARTGRPATAGQQDCP